MSAHEDEGTREPGGEPGEPAQSPPSGHPVRTPERRTWVFLEYLGLTLAVGVAVLVRTMYYEGIGAPLEIPDDIPFTPGISISSLMSGALSVFLMANVLLILLSRLVIWTENRPRLRLFIAAVIFIGSWGLIYVFVTSDYRLLRMAGFMMLGSELGFVMAVFFGAKFGAPAPGLSVPTVVVRMGGRPALLLIFLIATSAGVAFALGEYKTRARETWTTVRHEWLAQGSQRTWIVLGQDSGNHLVAPVEGQKILPLYRYVPASDRSSSLRPVKLGKLRPSPIATRAEFEKAQTPTRNSPPLMGPPIEARPAPADAGP